MVRITDLPTELLLEICRHLADELTENRDTSIYSVMKSCRLLHNPAFEVYFKLLPPSIQAATFEDKVACLRIFKSHDRRRRIALAEAVDRIPGWYIREHLMIKSIDYRDGKVVAVAMPNLLQQVQDLPLKDQTSLTKDWPRVGWIRDDEDP